MTSRHVLFAVALVAAGIGVYVARPAAQSSTTVLEIEISGGFAYIPEPANNKLAIAYLNSYSGPDCNVPQIGTELMIIRGKVDDYDGPTPMPPSRIFNLDKAKVTFRSLPNWPVDYPRRNWKPDPLKASHLDPAWRDNQYIPKITDHTGLTGYKIKDWRNDKKLVNGYMELRGGILTGAAPSDPTIEKASFAFEVGGVYQDTVSGTDKTIYRVVVNDDKVDIRFSGSSEGYRKLVLKPNASGEPVRLRLRGLHAMGAAATLADGEEIKDFCVFHQLLTTPTGGAPPSSDKWVKIFYKAPDANLYGAAMPSPGFFCDGGSF